MTDSKGEEIISLIIVMVIGITTDNSAGTVRALMVIGIMTDSNAEEETETVRTLAAIRALTKDMTRALKEREKTAIRTLTRTTLHSFQKVL
jgi:hypothetical protein